MRKPSIKARITAWYTGVLLLLLLLGAVYLLSFSERLSNRQLRETLADVVADAVKEARFAHGELDDDEIDFYRDGVSVFLYDTNGRLLAPRVNRGIQVDSILEDQAVKTVDSAGERWMVYDLYAVQDDVPFWVRGVLSLSGSSGMLRRMMLAALVGVPVFALVAAAGGWLITRKAFSAVGRMARAAETITSGSDLSLRVPDDGSGDELSMLGGTLNSMLGRLQASFERERRFTSDVSHELRTPVAVILSQCEYALSGAANQEERVKALEAVLRQARRMSAMLSQLMALARADLGRFTPEWEQVALSELCEMVLLELEDGAQTAGVRLCPEIAPGVALTGDETLLMRLVINLLSNAIRYNKPGGSVTLRLTETQTGCTLEVADTGIGIPEEALDKVWDRFYRAEPSRSSAGTGLGLAMADWIIRVHDGQRQVRSVYGEGSTFTVTLPKKIDNPGPF